ncbi:MULTISPECIES: hypothetical protein [Stenotrophomonas]|jgi:hypothetical protein|uniref:hypothetical protein n=1 Tax=Stenotrophomonas TaxID=40323 RepID=UPI000A69C3E6|nr:MULTISPECIES: hypothetical protein [Stenotrophomonas]MBH1694534.1 hypothetical protein [Stenotrophomonas maltophilia]MDH0551879.1 hypothetical protein [Stenotrophomonas sp. GD04006]MDT3491754.1 hypothetical protein [Stenotrophomonas maltophilia group sp. msm4]HEJ4267111.1 hypothetical protein [Pseudomonas aeruginosa]
MKQIHKPGNAVAAAAAIKQLSATCFRQDTVLVECKDASEHQTLLALALQALQNGHVREITDHQKSGCLDIRIEFRRPPIPMEDVTLRNA